MHYNYNADRPQATDRAGNPALRKNYYKWKNGECSIRVRKVPSSLGYVKFLMEALLSRLEHGPQEFDSEWENIVANKPPTLTSQLKKGSEPVTKRLSRFSK